MSSVWTRMWEYVRDNCWEVGNPDQADTNYNCPDPPYSTDPLCGDVCENQRQCDFDNDENQADSDHGGVENRCEVSRAGPKGIRKMELHD